MWSATGPSQVLSKHAAVLHAPAHLACSLQTSAMVKFPPHQSSSSQSCCSCHNRPGVGRRASCFTATGQYLNGCECMGRCDHNRCRLDWCKHNFPLPIDTTISQAPRLKARGKGNTQSKPTTSASPSLASSPTAQQQQQQQEQQQAQQAEEQLSLNISNGQIPPSWESPAGADNRDLALAEFERQLGLDQHRGIWLNLTRIQLPTFLTLRLQAPLLNLNHSLSPPPAALLVSSLTRPSASLICREGKDNFYLPS